MRLTAYILVIAAPCLSGCFLPEYDVAFGDHNWEYSPPGKQASRGLLAAERRPDLVPAAKAECQRATGDSGEHGFFTSPSRAFNDCMRARGFVWISAFSL